MDPQAPSGTSLFYYINEHIWASGEGLGTPNGAKRAPKDAPEKEENNQVEKRRAEEAKTKKGVQ